MSKLPTLVFIHGSWHTPNCYIKLTKPLEEKHNLKCVAITLPSTLDNPAASFKDDLDVAREAISNETSQGRDVVVVAHSYGGMVANSAIKGFAQPRDAAESSSTPTSTSPTEGHVIGLILIASGFTLTGMTFMDPFFGHPPPSWRVNKETGYAELVTPPRELFYHDLPAEEAEYWVSQLTTQSLKSLFEGREVSYAGWMDVPVWFIGTVEDRGLPVLAQRMAVGMAREMGATVEHRELQTSHSPFLSQPEETLGLVLEAVEAFTGKSLDNALAKRAESKEIIVPASRLFQPRTWFKFGLPLGFGHVLGRGILIYGWVKRLWSGR